MPQEQTVPAAPTRVLLTVEEAAEQLTIGRTTLYALIRTGAIPSVRIGKLRRLRPADLAAYTARLSA
ncbi:helix-turn-helix domain-containing protein [Frankia sp. AgB32]|uniref:helix-turn-helix domain-containing protein n=1 Tax=Frankia sp. AgB32 TaxID=631119 RepID=UPI0024B1C12E